MIDQAALSVRTPDELVTDARVECVNILVSLRGAEVEPGSMMKRQHWQSIRTYARRVLEDATAALGYLGP